MELTDHDRRLMAGTRDRMLMEQIEEAELATTRKEATAASYLEVVEKLRRKTYECEQLRRALWGAAALAGLFFVIAVAAVVRGIL